MPYGPHMDNNCMVCGTGSAGMYVCDECKKRPGGTLSFSGGSEDFPPDEKEEEKRE